MYKSAIKTDKELEQMNQPAASQANDPFGLGDGGSNFMMGDAEMMEQYKIMQ